LPVQHLIEIADEVFTLGNQPTCPWMRVSRPSSSTSPVHTSRI
jgi:hypothetical protein